MLRKIIIRIIEVYQKSLSPDHGWLKGYYPGGYCKYTPSCSDYFKMAVNKKGAVRGTALGIWRIMRCNPWSKGGKDTVS